MYVLIIWSALCTSADPGCMTGDYIEFGIYQNKVSCIEVREAWRASSEHHRAVCYYSEGKK